DPFTEVRTATQLDLARRLTEAGNEVTLLLVQTGVSPARQGAHSDSFDALCNSEVRLLADRFSLQMREITSAQLKPGITEADVDIVIDAMLAGDKVIWN
ncbi:MAG: DsrE family protein, partial [Spongiibacteraceae bacterium]|nr:DsrE family protein [Spongiibacteraceae bacterium]